MTKENSKFLITAAGGKVGQHVVTRLARKRIPARAGVHSRPECPRFVKVGSRRRFSSLRIPLVQPLRSRVSKVFLVTPGSPDQGRHEENLLAEAKRVGVKRVVKLSGKIADHHTAGFSQWNRDAERRIKESGISYTILRGNYFMQNLFGNAQQIKQGALTNGPAAKRIALIDARDIAAVAVAALTEEGHAGKTYDPSGPELLTVTRRPQ